MAKEKNYNPVQAQRKADKARAIKKSKSELQQRRNDKLARKNPERIEKHIDELKSIASGGGKLSSHQEQLLAGLEKELGAVKRAREALGDQAPSFSRPARREGGPDRGALGKRRRGQEDGSSSDEEEIEPEVQRIPMPRDTPPPIPKHVLDAWYAKRRARRQAQMPQGPDDGATRQEDAKKMLPTAAVESKTVYEAKPMMRDLRREAVAAFVPATVQMKMRKGQGQGGLVEPEEADQLEREGYLGSKPDPTAPNPRAARVEEAADEERA